MKLRQTTTILIEHSRKTAKTAMLGLHHTVYPPSVGEESLHKQIEYMAPTVAYKLSDNLTFMCFLLFDNKSCFLLLFMFEILLFYCSLTIDGFIYCCYRNVSSRTYQISHLGSVHTAGLNGQFFAAWLFTL